MQPAIAHHKRCHYEEPQARTRISHISSNPDAPFTRVPFLDSHFHLTVLLWSTFQMHLLTSQAREVYSYSRWAGLMDDGAIHEASS